MTVIDIACLVVVGIIVYCVSTEGMWGAVQTFLCVLLAALVAMNFFEPLAGFLDGIVPAYRNYMDVIALVGLFIGLTFALRMGSEHLTPVYIGLPSTLDQVGKWLFGALTGYLTMAFLLTALHTAPLSREFMGFKPERNNFFGMAPDRQWLGFVQYVTEKSFAKIIGQDPDTKQLIAHAFDGRYQLLGDKTAAYPNTIWPSFPIRYAMRRERLENNPAGGGGATPAPVPQMVPMPVNPNAPVGF